MTTLTYKTKPYPHQDKALRKLLHNRGGGLQVPTWLARQRVYIMPNGCWELISCRSEKGYAIIWDGKRQRRAHRAVFEFVHNVILPSCIQVRHKCDNPPCVRPSHLRSGSAKGNSREMVRRGRHRPSGCRGEAHGLSKLTDTCVASIRREHLNGSSIDLLSAAYGVGRSTIYNVVIRRTWIHV
jgi:HNH endonuclease